MLGGFLAGLLQQLIQSRRIQLFFETFLRLAEHTPHGLFQFFRVSGIVCGLMQQIPRVECAINIPQRDLLGTLAKCVPPEGPFALVTKPARLKAESNRRMTTGFVASADARACEVWNFSGSVAINASASIAVENRRLAAMNRFS